MLDAYELEMKCMRADISCYGYIVVLKSFIIQRNTTLLHWFFEASKDMDLDLSMCDKQLRGHFEFKFGIDPEKLIDHLMGGRYNDLLGLVSSVSKVNWSKLGF